MKNVFSYDSKLMCALSTIADVLVINILFTVCCVPIFTIGAARSALHTVCNKWTKKENAGAREFLSAFKDNFRSATLLWLTFLGVGLVIALDYYILWNSSFDNKNTMMKIVAVPTAVYLFALSRVFEIVSWFNCKYGQYLHNSLLISIAHPVSTLIHIVLMVLPFVLFFLQTDVFAAAGLIWVLVYFPIEGLIDAVISKKTYDRLVNLAISDSDGETQKSEIE